MTSLQLARPELKRMTSGKLPRVALVALTLVPLLYGALYLYANWDPYSNLDKVTAAVVNEDTGAEAPDGGRLDAGGTVVSGLLDSGTFHWVQVGSAAAADQGVADGDYSFALKIPADFSANLASPADFDAARQAILNVTTNDANNFVLHSIVDRVTAEVHDTVAEEVGSRTANQLLTGYGTVHAQLVKAGAGATKLAGGAATLDSGTDDAASGAADLRTGAEDLHDGAVRLATGTSGLAGGAARVAEGAAKLQDGAASLASGGKDLADGQQQLLKGAGTLATGAADLDGGLAKLDTNAAGLPEQTRALADGAGQVAGGIASVDEQVRQASAALDAAEQQQADHTAAVVAGMVSSGALSQAQADALLQELGTAGSAGTPAGTQVQALAGALDQLAAASRSVADGAGQLADAAPALSAGLDQAAGGASRLADGAAGLASGQQEAYDGAVRLGGGASELGRGASALAGGAAKLADGAAAADGGAAKLADGAAQLAGGAAALADGTAALAEGAGTLDDGAAELADRLGSGADGVPDPSGKVKERAAGVIADPVAVHSLAQTKAANYGAGMAPFFLALAMWIGVFMLVQIMRTTNRRALASNAAPWRTAVGSWLPFLVVATAQASLLYLVVRFGLGLDPAHPVLVWLLLVLAGVCFSAIIQGVVALLGTPGKFVVLILLVLQLVSSGGTFPWETVPEPLRTIHGIMPMGYVVAGLRHLIYGGGLQPAAAAALALAGYTLLGLLLGVAAARKHRFWTLKTLHPEMTT